MLDLPLSDRDHLDRLGADLAAAGYTTDGVLSQLGPSAAAALGRSERLPALRATADGGALATLIRLFLVGADVAAPAVDAALPESGVHAGVVAGLLTIDGDVVRAALDVRPYAADENEYLVVSDLDNDVRPGPLRRDHVLGIGTASLTLARAVPRDPVDSVLDLGTGCGIQALHCAGHAGHVVATDTNPRALALAAATARLSGQRWELRRGSLFAPAADEQFDLVVSNPPFVIGTGDQEYEYRDSGRAGDALCAELISTVGQHLTDGGTASLLANWLVQDGADWRDRVGSWVAASGLDAWVVQRELADPAEYVALWLKDAGQTGPSAEVAAVRWLDYLAAERVSGIGMGVVTLRRSGADRPDVLLDEITGAAEEISGEEVAGLLARRRWLADQDDRGLLNSLMRLDPAVVLETRSLPGGDGWIPVLRMLRRVGGPGASVQVDDWGQALLAGCTGAVPLTTLFDLLTAASGVDRDALVRALLPTVVAAVTRGLLQPSAA